MKKEKSVFLCNRLWKFSVYCNQSVLQQCLDIGLCVQTGNQEQWLKALWVSGIPRTALSCWISRSVRFRKWQMQDECTLRLLVQQSLLWDISKNEIWQILLLRLSVSGLRHGKVVDSLIVRTCWPWLCCLSADAFSFVKLTCATAIRFTHCCCGNVPASFAGIAAENWTCSATAHRLPAPRMLCHQDMSWPSISPWWYSSGPATGRRWWRRRVCVLCFFLLRTLWRTECRQSEPWQSLLANMNAVLPLWNLPTVRLQ